MPRSAPLATSLTLAFMAQAALAQHLTDPKTEASIDALLQQMTLAEKVGQLNQYSNPFDVTGPPPTAGQPKVTYEQIQHGLVGSMLNITGAEATRRAQQIAVDGSRLHIPMLFGYDVIHGYQTIFPIPLGEAASWDLAAIEQSARVAATEAAAAGLHWTFAPMVDVARDARWGRIMEGAGEDAWLGARIAEARVRGFQGHDLAAVDTIAACAKHYAAYGFAEAGRDYNTVDISEQTLRNVVLVPFRAAAAAGVATFMNSFNEIGGIPATASVHLQRDILKGEWGFDGFVVSDWGSIAEMIPHGYAADLAQAAQQAITAGSDMDMESRAYLAHLEAWVKAGKVDEKWIDDAVRRVLRVKHKLGLLADPYRYSDVDREQAAMRTPANLAAARDVARKSIVLLQNRDAVLPLAKDTKSIAVIGPLAHDKDSPLGNWRGQGAANSAVSLLEGVQGAVSANTRVLYAEGCKLVTGARNFMAPPVYETSDRSGFAAAVAAARAADVVLLAIGEDAFQSGEGRSQADIGLKGLQQELFAAVVAANPNVVVVVMSGRPLLLGELAARAPALLQTWLLGSASGHAIADVLFGDYNPTGKLPVSFPRHVGQLPLYYGQKNTGRPGPEAGVTWSHYTDVGNDALFPFGFGLAYTQFAIGKPQLSRKELARDGALQVTVQVTNTGPRAGAEIVQLYVRDQVGSVTRPVKELKGFQKVELQPGQARDVTFVLTAADLAFWTAQGRWESEPGAFTVFVGSNCRDVQAAGFTLR